MNIELLEDPILTDISFGASYRMRNSIVNNLTYIIWKNDLALLDVIHDAVMLRGITISDILEEQLLEYHYERK